MTSHRQLSAADLGAAKWQTRRRLVTRWPSCLAGGLVGTRTARGQVDADPATPLILEPFADPVLDRLPDRALIRVLGGAAGAGSGRYCPVGCTPRLGTYVVRTRYNTGGPERKWRVDGSAVPAVLRQCQHLLSGSRSTARSAPGAESAVSAAQARRGGRPGASQATAA